MQRSVGNRAVCRLLADGPADGATALGLPCRPSLGAPGSTLQRLNGAVPQNFAVTNAVANSTQLTIRTDKAWASSTGSLADLSDVEMRERVDFNHNPAVDMPSYPVVVPTIPGMALNGTLLTKVAGAMSSGAGSDNHQGAGYGVFFTAPGGQPNLRRAAWTLIGTQTYEYRDRGAHGAWQPLHGGTFTITRTMAVNPGTHRYELTFTKTGPFGVNVTAGPTPVSMTMDEAMSDVAAARPDQTPLWNALDNEITVNQEHEYHTVNTENRVVNGMGLRVDYVITRPRTAPPQSPNRAAFALYETLTPTEYNALFNNIRSGLDVLIEKYMGTIAAMPARVVMIITKATGGVRQQALFTAGVGGPTLRIVFRHGKFATVDPTSKDTSMAGKESKKGSSTANKNARWQKATVIHEMGHLLHAFTSMDKFQAATVDPRAAAAAAAAIQPQMYKIAEVNQRIIQALNAKHYKGEWQYAQDNPAEVVAEVWTAIMHGRSVPRGLAAVYLAYGGARSPTIDNSLRKLFPHKQIPALATPEAALAYI